LPGHPPKDEVKSTLESPIVWVNIPMFCSAWGSYNRLYSLPSTKVLTTDGSARVLVSPNF
jgi:hypothetical protein